MNPPPSNRPPPRSKEIAPEFRKYGDSFDRLDLNGNEVGPSASQWGTSGWTYLTEEGAWEKYRALLQIGSSRGSEGLEEGGDPQEDAPAIYVASLSNQPGGGKAP